MSAVSCPTTAELRQFVLGKAAEADIARLATHIESCEACLNVLPTLRQGDPLVSALRALAGRQSQSDSSPVRQIIQRLTQRGGEPGKSIGGNAGEMMPTPDPIESAPGTVTHPPGAAASGRLSEPSTLSGDKRKLLDPDLAPLLAPAESADELGRLGPYRVLKVLGKGGMGVVFLAQDPKLERLVAVKAMLSIRATGDAGKQRFLREARAAAAVQHDNIVVIHQVGEDRGVPFLAMEHLEGETLEARLRSAGPLPLVEVLRIGTELALALAAAHTKGLVHRDVKPSNVWLVAGTGRVKVLDFGLVRATREEGHLTVAGAFLGTPAFMAPEQILDPNVEPPADLFSLGCVLYLLSTGSLAFKSQDAISVRLGGQRSQPPSPRQLDPALPAEFSALVMQLLEPEPHKRPASAANVAEELRRLAVPKPVKSSRRLLVAGLAAVVLLALALVVVRVPTASGEVTIATDDPDIELVVRNGGLLRIRDTRNNRSWELDAGKYTLGLADQEGGLTVDLPGEGPVVLRRNGQKVVLITRGKAQGDPTEVASVGRRVPADNLERGAIPLAALAWPGGAPEQAPPELVAILGDGRFRVLGETGRPSLSPDGKLLAVPSRSEVMLFETETGRYRRSFRGHTDQLYAAVFSPDGQTLASAGRDCTIRLWEVGTGRPIHSLSEHQGPVLYLAFNSEGTRLASASDDKTVCVWDVRTGKKIQRLIGHTSNVYSVAFHPNGQRLASGSWDWTVRVWDVASGAQEQLFRVEEAKEQPGGINDLLMVSFSPDGTQLAAGNDNAVRVWDTKTWKRTLLRQTPAQFVAFTPDSQRLLTSGGTHSGSRSLTVKRWNAGTGQLLATLPLRSSGSLGLNHLSKDGKTLAACSPWECVVHLYDAETGKPRFPDPGHTKPLEGVAFSPDGRLLASGGQDQVIRLWDISTGKECRQFIGHTDTVRDIIFFPDSKTLASASIDKTVRLWDVASGRLLWTFTDHTAGVQRIHLGPDGKILASASNDRTVRLWDIAERTLVRALEGFKGRVDNAVFSPDGKWLAAVSEEDGTVQIWDASTGVKRRSLTLPDPASGITFLSDGDSLIVPSRTGLLRVYSVAAGAVQQTVRGDVPLPVKLHVRTGGRLLGSAGMGGAFQLWDWSSQPPRRKTYRLFPYDTWLNAAVFSPDGRYLATANPDGTVYLYRFASPGVKTLPGLSHPDVVLRPTRQFTGHQDHLYYVAFSRDGQRAFSAGLDSTARIWDVATETEQHRLRHPAQVIRLAVSRDDRFLLTTCADWIVRIWDIARGTEVRRLEGTHHPWALSLAPDGRTVLTTGPVKDGKTALVMSDFLTGKELRQLPDGGHAAWTPDGKLLVTDFKLRVIDAAKGGLVFALHGHKWIRDVAVSPDGSLGLSCGGPRGDSLPSGNLHDDCSVRLWDLRTGRELRRWQENSYTRFGIAFTPGGRRAVAGSDDGTIRVYDVSTGKELACLEAPVGVHGVAVSPDGRSILGGCHDGVLRLWQLPDGVADPPPVKEP